MRINRLVGNLKAYSSAAHVFFMERPMLANSCTGLVTFTLGDLLSQSCAQSKSRGYICVESIDITRSLRTGCFGVFMNGVMLHHWYRVLDRVFGATLKSTKTTIQKCVVDQMVYAPFSIGAFFAYAAVNKGGSLDDMKGRFADKSKESFIETWIADCTVWPLINAVSFSVIPTYIRPTFVGLAQIGWQTYLCYVGFRDCSDLVGGDTSQVALDMLALRDNPTGKILTLDVKSPEVL